MKSRSRMLKTAVGISAAFCCFVLASCVTPNLVLSPNLQQGTDVMEAAGRQGWQFNQVIEFGDYSTSQVQRGWTSGFGGTFFVSFQNAKQKMSFEQFTPDRERARVNTVGKFSSTDLPLFDDSVFVNFAHESSYAGSIIPDNKEFGAWDFIITDPDGGFPSGEFDGKARSDRGDVIDIRGVKRIEGQVALMEVDNFGFEFFQDGRSVGAVSTLNNGRVWMRQDLSSETRLILASLSSSILLRHSLQDSFE